MNNFAQYPQLTHVGNFARLYLSFKLHETDYLVIGRVTGDKGMVQLAVKLALLPANWVVITTCIDRLKRTESQRQPPQP